MTTSGPQSAPAACRRSPGLVSRVGRLVRRGWRAYWDRRARRATVLLLQSLDERTLRDIGIAPGEIQSLVGCRADDRLRRYDPTWPRPRP